MDTERPYTIHNTDCVAGMAEHLAPESCDLCVTSIPFAEEIAALLPDAHPRVPFALAEDRGADSAGRRTRAPPARQHFMQFPLQESHKMLKFYVFSDGGAGSPCTHRGRCAKLPGDGGPPPHKTERR